MANTRYDWATIQLFYDEGNSWREVHAKFGIHNRSIRLAIGRGELVSRSRKESICLKLGVEPRPPMICLHCEKDFWAHSRKAKFCSIICYHTRAWIHKTIPKILEGKTSHTTLRKYRLEVDKVCAECGLGQEWNGKPIALHLDHIDGNSDNNTLENTRLLCPNCHSQTDNFGIKNKGAQQKKLAYVAASK